MLLQADLLPEREQRVAALTILQQLYRGETLINNPFASIFLHVLVSEVVSWWVCFKGGVLVPSRAAQHHRGPQAGIPGPVA